MHNKDIIRHFNSLLVNSGRFQLTSTIYNSFSSITNGDLIWPPRNFMLVRATSRGYFLISGAAQRAALCIKHYLRYPTVLVLKTYLLVTILSARGHSKLLPTGGIGPFELP